MASLPGCLSSRIKGFCFSFSVFALLKYVVLNCKTDSYLMKYNILLLKIYAASVFLGGSVKYCFTFVLTGVLNPVFVILQLASYSRHVVIKNLEFLHLLFACLPRS